MQNRQYIFLKYKKNLNSGQVEVWREGAQEYFGQFGTNYYSDLVTMYAALNLTARYGNAVAFANLVSKSYKSFKFRNLQALPITSE